MKKCLTGLCALLLILSLAGCTSTTDATTQAPEWTETTLLSSTLYEVNIRAYTEEGTFAAFETHLPRLKELGVEILWLMPIHPIPVPGRLGTLGSPYAVGDYYDVNSDYGTLEDFGHLVDTAHELGFKVILDLVANHTGWDNPWITEHPEWYTQDEQGNIISPAGTGWNDVADLNYNDFHLWTEMIRVMKYWVETYDIDGYRCDFAGGVPVDFWESAKKQLDLIKPLFMLAEDGENPSLLDQAFQANFSFAMMDLINGIAAGTKTAGNVKTLLENNVWRYPASTFPLYYATNHDINAWQGSIPTLLGNAEGVMNVLVFTAPGLPLLYSGQEIGLDRSLMFFEKDEIDWTGWETNATFLFYQKLIRLKKDQSVLSASDLSNLAFLRDGNADILCYVRENTENRVMVLLNLSVLSQSFSVETEGYEGLYQDYFGQTDLTIGSSVEFTLEPWGYRVYTQDRP